MTDPDNNATPTDSGKRYEVLAPWWSDSFTGEGFPDMGTEPVEMSAEEVDNAKAAAKASGFYLKTREV